uniref:Uncharacterized protein n=1 Tax=Chromera velia CCMP2878 TaxID=1169474 RepID=A0A0G4GH12_9ALVE|eukprot:Cvel_4690.t1-p1 / transcript=Cvel_4690.t1 / gene=Cvel_4690 / organism=Chromera_velia_CCMP2878 / gene_product=hypothetical protein / transcript_product=hypothetical protein / location=Cvel_scaffold208:67441-76444(-) / protein_length=508 / sequence_SO=supercontig / SO=protein_coding / is_pseudo=false
MTSPGPTGREPPAESNYRPQNDPTQEPFLAFGERPVAPRDPSQPLPTELPSRQMTACEQKVHQWIDTKPKKKPKLLITMPKVQRQGVQIEWWTLIGTLMIPVFTITGTIILVMMSEFFVSNAWLENWAPLFAYIVMSVGIWGQFIGQVHVIAGEVVGYLNNHHAQFVNQVDECGSRILQEWENIAAPIDAMKTEQAGDLARFSTASTMRIIQAAPNDNFTLPSFTRIDKLIEAGRSMLTKRITKLRNDVDQDPGMYTPWGFSTIGMFTGYHTCFFCVWFLVVCGFIALFHQTLDWPPVEDELGPQKQVFILAGFAALQVVLIFYFSGPGLNKTLNFYIFIIERNFRDVCANELDEALDSAFIKKTKQLEDLLNEHDYNFRKAKMMMDESGRRGEVAGVVADIGGQVAGFGAQVQNFFKKVVPKTAPKKFGGEPTIHTHPDLGPGGSHPDASSMQYTQPGGMDPYSSAQAMEMGNVGSPPMNPGMGMQMGEGGVNTPPMSGQMGGGRHW